jgi:hypothetical protein
VNDDIADTKIDAYKVIERCLTNCQNTNFDFGKIQNAIASLPSLSPLTQCAVASAAAVEMAIDAIGILIGDLIYFSGEKNKSRIQDTLRQAHDAVTALESLLTRPIVLPETAVGASND